MKLYIYSVLVFFNFFSFLNAEDCTKFELELDNNSNKILTKEEEIELMDKELYKSLSKFERCVVNSSGSSSSSSSSAGAGEGGNGSNASENTSSGDNSEALINSVPSQSITGTEGSGSVESRDATENTEFTEGTEGDGKDNVVLDNGKIPDDIPSDDNDTILEKQIRKAAMEETDPEKKKRLWNTYREYKGLDKQ